MTASENQASVEPVLRSVRDGVCTITLNRPERLNALNHPMGLQLCDELAACDANSEVAIVVIEGAGRAFCSGDELGRAPNEDEEFRRSFGFARNYAEGPARWTTAIQIMRRLRQPVIAKVHGYAYGAGFNLALGADFRLMSRSAKLCTPFVKRGLGTGANLLQEFVGVGRALELVLLAEPIDAVRALELGLVTEVVEDDAIDAAVSDLAERLKTLPAGALSVTKRAVYNSWHSTTDVSFWNQATAALQTRVTGEFDAGVASFHDRQAGDRNR